MASERRALVELAESVIIAHANVAPLPAGTMRQFSSGEVEPRLVDQALTIAEAARRRQQVNLAMDAPPDDF